jgi:hypothetical protein
LPVGDLGPGRRRRRCRRHGSLVRLGDGLGAGGGMPLSWGRDAFCTGTLLACVASAVDLLRETQSPARRNNFLDQKPKLMKAACEVN